MIYQLLLYSLFFLFIIIYLFTNFFIMLLIVNRAFDYNFNDAMQWFVSPIKRLWTAGNIIGKFVTIFIAIVFFIFFFPVMFFCMLWSLCRSIITFLFPKRNNL